MVAIYCSYGKISVGLVVIRNPVICSSVVVDIPQAVCYVGIHFCLENLFKTSHSFRPVTFVEWRASIAKITFLLKCGYIIVTTKNVKVLPYPVFIFLREILHARFIRNHEFHIVLPQSISPIILTDYRQVFVRNIIK